MRIAYDPQVFTFQVYGGVSRYFYNLADKISHFDETEIAIVAPFYINAYLKKSPRKNYIKGIPIPTTPKSELIAKLIAKKTNSLLAPSRIRNFRPDVIHETYYNVKSFAPKGIPRIVTVYDMIHEKYASEPGSSRTLMAKKASINRADFVICISENTRQELLNLFDLPEHRVSTVHLGYDLIESQVNNLYVKNTNRKNKPYLLYVGAREGYKNFLSIIAAYAHAGWLKESFNLVCFGGGKFKLHEKNLILDLKLSPEQVIHISGDDAELVKAYQNAAVFVYPSLYEGFGIPPLEAMSLGCPVACSDRSSIPEVVGSAGEYFEPDDIESIIAALDNVLNSIERRNKLILVGRERCGQFSWDKCAYETAKVYEKFS